jgi:hypothetical protein
MRKLVWLLVLVVLGSCARVMPPSGGERDEEAPRVVETHPEQNAAATEWAGTNREVRIVFHETLSERSPRELVMVSPETGEVRAERDGREVKVTIAGGWQPGRVYRVTVMPGIVDRFGNARSTPYELVFSTGAAILKNALGGIATDRITGKPAQGARVEAILQTDSTRYTTVTDSSGFFALRSLPVGRYETRIYLDQNRNRVPDGLEAVDTRRYDIGEADTLAVELALLAPDTTPARLLRAVIRDSMQVRLSFDDYMEANAPLRGLRLTAWQLPDSMPHGAGRFFTPRDFEAMRADTTDERPRRDEPADTTRLLPINELVWVPMQPLRPETRYRFIVTGYRNIRGVTEGGGSTVALSPARARPPADSTAARRDTIPAPRDTIPTPRDTVPAAPPDTTRR